MDEMESVIVSVSGDVEVAQAEEWFRVLCGAADDFGENWSLFKDVLATRAYEASFSSEVTEKFVTYMEENVSDQVDLLQKIRERRDRDDDLPQLYERLVAEEAEALAALAAEGGVEAPAEGVMWDPETAAQWYEHLTQTVGHGWTGWSGYEAEWEAFKHYFLEYAQQAEVWQEASNLLTIVEAYPDKIEGFKEQGITITVPAAEEVVAEQAEVEDQWGSYSVKEWYDYLTTGWDGWSGREDDWAAFKYYFLEYAANANAHAGAAAFLQEVEDSGNKHEALAKYDIHPAVPAPPPPTAPPPPEPKVPPPAVSGEAPEKTFEEELIEKAGQIAARAMERLQQDKPDLAASVSPEELRELAAQATSRGISARRVSN